MSAFRGGLWLIALVALQFTVVAADTALDSSSLDDPAAPAGPGAPEIQITGPVSSTAESTLSYTTTGAVTQHALVPNPPRLAGSGSVELLVNGDFSSAGETATLNVEGTSFPTVNGADCSPVGKKFHASAAQLDAWLTNFFVNASVTNTSAVNATQCPVNNHTVRLTYFGVDPTTPELTFDTVVFGTTTTLPLEIRNTGTASLNVTNIASNSGAFVPLTTSLVVPAGTATIVTVSFTPSTIAPHTGTLSIASDDADEPLITVPLSGAGTPIQVSPTSIITQLSGSQSLNQNVTVTNPGSSTLSWTVAESPPASWLTVFSTGGSIPPLGSSIFGLTLTAPLPAGEYVTNLVFQTVPPSPQDVTVPVHLFVVEPQIGVTPSTLTTTHDDEEFSNHAFTLSNAGIGSLFYSVSDSVPWLSVSISGNSLLPGGSRNFTVFLDSQDLPGGVHTGSITFTSNDPDGPLTIPVQLTVVPASIGFLPSTLSASLDLNQSVNRTLTVTNGGPGTLLFEVFDVPQWISVSPDFGSVPPGGFTQITVTFSAGTIPPGTYNSSIDFSSNDPASPHFFPVQLTVLSPSIGVSPPTLSATLDISQTSMQTLTVSNGGPGTLSFNVAESATWLSVSPAGGSLVSGSQTPITVTFNALSSLAPGVYNTQISVTSNDPDGAILVPVTLTILGPVMEVTPASLTATLDVGETDVRTLTVRNTGQGVLAFTASDNAPWLSVAPTSGNVSGGQQTGLTVTFDAAGLGPGTYNGFITLVDNIPASPNLNVPVTLIRPPGSISVAPGSIDATLFADDVTHETVTVSNSGPGTLTLDFVSTGSGWLSVTPSAAVLPPGQSVDLDVTISADDLAAGTYDSFVSVENDDPVSGLVFVPVHLTVVDSPPDIGVGESPFATESVQSYSTAGAATSHVLTSALTPSGGGTIEVIAEGNFGSVSETALVLAEGKLVGVVGASGQSCGTAQQTFTLSPIALTALAADGTVQVVVDNEPDVGAVCPVNRHTVRLSYLPAADALAFNAVAVGTSAERQLIVRNDGAQALEIGSIATGGAPFSVVPATVSVPAGTSTTVTVTFSPTNTGSFNGALTFLSNDPDEPTYVVDLSGTGGVAPSIGIAPGGVDATLISGARGLETLTVSNTGGTDLEFSVAAEWVVAPPTPTAVFVNVDPWHGTVAPGGSLELDVHVTTIGLPPGAFQASLRFASNDPASPEVVVPATLTLLSAPHLQIPGTPVTLDSTIPYAAAGATTAHAFATSAAPVGGGSLTHIFHGNYQAPGRTATIDAEGTLYAPVGNVAQDCTAVTGSRPLDPSFVESLAASGTFAFEVTNSPAVQASCPTNQHRLRLGYTPELAAIDFGEVSLPIPASRAVLLRNTGTETLEVTSIATDDPQFTVSVGSATIPAGASALVLVTALPATEGPASALLVIESDDPDRSLVELPLAALGVCHDADGDGLTTCEGDCDDTKPNCTTDCTDADDDDFCVTTDCDDASPSCNLNCTDADADGVAACDGDCNDTNPFCTTTCTDTDHDGFCVTTDCDDAKPNCTTNCTDADADGFCVTTDCDDTKPNCTTNCTDADADGFCVTTDCDDTSPSCALDCTDADGDGVPVCEGDCDDAKPHCTTDCTDADADGFCVTTDCDDAKPNCTTNCTDADADGFCVTTDCDDAKPNCTTNCTDADADGFCVTTDCDDTKPNCTTNCTDADADGFCVTTDCDDARPSCTTDCTDADADGFCVTTDCDDAKPQCTTNCTDADADGFCVTTDCDDAKPQCTTNCTDADADGFCITTDCDEANPHCTADCTDADADGYCVTIDCDDASAACNVACTDADSDGSRICEGDCDDADATAYPGAAEVCTDSTDNDCDSLADEQDAPCAGLVADGLRFEAGSPASLSWDPAPGADRYALYRGSIPGSGFVPYDHLCHAAEVASTVAIDPSVPPPTAGFYYLVTGQAVSGSTLQSGPLGRASSGSSRPDSASIPCGARLHVDPDLVVGQPDGRSWATAYPSVAAAFGDTQYADRGLELWVRGTASGSASLSVRPGAVLYGGFAGTESSSWERDSVLNPTVLDGGGAASVIASSGKSLVLDGLTLTNAGRGLSADPAGSHVELRDVRLVQLGLWGIELRSLGSRLIVENATHDGSGAGGVFAYTDAGRLDGRIRRNVFSAGATDAALRLEARTVAGSSEVALDIVGNRIEGGTRGMRLGAAVQNVARQAVQSSFVASNVIYGTTEAGLRVEATGSFTAGTGSALAEARPLVVGNTVSDGSGAGVVTSATRSDTSGNPLLHPMRAVPELWDNLVTFHPGPGVQESADNVALGLVADPAAFVGNDLFGNGTIYLDEGATSLTLAQVNALAGAFDNYDAEPGYHDGPAGDYHLSGGAAVGVGSSIRYLANTADPGFGFAWIGTVFDDSDWDVGAYGVGYDVAGDANGLIETPVPPGASSIFTRSSFEVSDASEVLTLTLGVDYDDGWVAWLNGVEVARSASMPPGPVNWNTASAEHESSNGSMPTFEETDISLAGLPALVTGTNVLAIGVWNTGPASADLVLVPRVTLDVELAPIDAGHLEAPRLAAEDSDGEPRVTDGNLDGLARPDGGADERQ